VIDVDRREELTWESDPFEPENQNKNGYNHTRDTAWGDDYFSKNATDRPKLDLYDPAACAVETYGDRFD